MAGYVIKLLITVVGYIMELLILINVEVIIFWGLKVNEKLPSLV